jgi:hypothetical protein
MAMNHKAELCLEASMPADRGALPIGGRLVRTEPSGPVPARIAFVGLYPAVTRLARFKSKDGTRLVPVEVESHSFCGSASAHEIDSKYLRSLNLTREQVFMIDLYPYYLATTAKSGERGRTMWDNIVAYTAEHGSVAVQRRPDADEMVEWCRTLPGNAERLAYWFARCRPAIVITLGNEVAAFARGYKGDGAAKRAQAHLYEDCDAGREPFKTEAFGAGPVRILHCAHPGILMREKDGAWAKRHEDWCAGAGGALVSAAIQSDLRSRDPAAPT